MATTNDKMDLTQDFQDRLVISDYKDGPYPSDMDESEAPPEDIGELMIVDTIEESFDEDMRDEVTTTDDEAEHETDDKAAMEDTVGEPIDEDVSMSYSTPLDQSDYNLAEEFPADAPIDYPHIIRDPLVFEDDRSHVLRLCDAVFTMLYNLKEDWDRDELKDLLKDFMDWEIEFKLVLTPRNYPNTNKFVIWREGKDVFTGFYHGRLHHSDWSFACVSRIADDGKWTPVWGVVTGTTTPGMVDAHNGIFQEIGLMRSPNMYDPDEAFRVSHTLAKVIIGSKLWEAARGHVAIIIN